MNPMMAAIKKKRGGMQESDMSGVDESTAQPTQGAGLHEFVAGLNDAQKAQLKGMLDKSSKAVTEIQKGGPSSKEQAMIAEASSEENMRNAAIDESDELEMNAGGEDKSDEIAMSMLDHKAKTGNPDVKPLNLGDRMKMSLAQKLKSKGKL